MSKQHILKIHPKPLADLLSGAKTCEIRFNDRGFEVGDTVRLQEIDPATEQLTGRPDLVRVVTHIQQGYGLPDHLCVLSYAQPAAGDPVAIANRGKGAFWVKWTDAAEGLYGPGIKLYAAPPAADPVAAGEPVYQCKRKGGIWHECSKVTYNCVFAGEEFEKRILWSAPSAAEPMAVGDPVAWRQIGHKVRLEWFETKGGWMDGAPPKFLADGVKEGWCRLELAYAAPPAAAHGDEAVQYRLLRVGEIIQATDELLRDDCTTWQPMSDGPQMGIGWRWHSGLMPVRRVDPAMRAQAGEGGEV